MKRTAWLASLRQMLLPRYSRSRWAWIAGAYIGLYSLWLILRPASETARMVGGHLALVPVGLFALLAALSQRNAGVSRPLRRLWTFLGLGLGLWTLGGVIWVLYGLLQSPHPPLPSIADPFYMAGHLLTLAALLSLPFIPRGQFGRLRLLLDLVMLSGVTAIFGWVLLLQPVLASLLTRPAETLWTAIYPLLDVGILLILANVLLGLEAAEVRAALRWVGGGLVAVVIADLAYTYLSLRGQVDTDFVFDLGRLIGFSLIGLGALPRSQLGETKARPFSTALPRWLSLWQVSLPAAAMIALVWYLIVDWQADGRVSPTLAAVTALLVLVLVARQGVVAGERELRQYAQLVDSAADPAFICDGAGRLQLINPALVAALAGRDAAEFIGQDIFNLFAPGSLPSELRFPPRGFSGLALESGWSGEVNLRRGDGSSFPIYLSLRPVPQTAAARPLLAGTAHDLSVQKRQQAALIAAYEAAAAARRAVEDLNAQLEAKVEEKTRSLSEAYAQLEKQNEELKTLDQLKSDFVSLVSHELRAPLTNISGGIELVLARRDDLPAKTRDHLTLVQAEIRRLTSFVETILDLSALEAGRLPMNPAPLPLARLVEAIRAPLAAAPGGERLRVHVPPDLPPVLADERALASVLFHLVDNALKYAPEGEVVISAETDAFCVVRVCDRGPGVPAHLREAIFDKFQRLNGGDAQVVYGHGLGLYMVRHLLRAMRGDIRVEDAPGGGACFMFWLPVAWGEAL